MAAGCTFSLLAQKETFARCSTCTRSFRHLNAAFKMTQCDGGMRSCKTRQTKVSGNRGTGDLTWSSEFCFCSSDITSSETACHSLLPFPALLHSPLTMSASYDVIPITVKKRLSGATTTFSCVRRHLHPPFKNIRAHLRISLTRKPVAD